MEGNDGQEAPRRIRIQKRKVRLEPWMIIPWLLTRRQERYPTTSAQNAE
ncbi:hypothetical protein [Trueperella pyogenes]